MSTFVCALVVLTAAFTLCYPSCIFSANDRLLDLSCLQGSLISLLVDEGPNDRSTYNYTVCTNALNCSYRDATPHGMFVQYGYPDDAICYVNAVWDDGVILPTYNESTKIWTFTYRNGDEDHRNYCPQNRQTVFKFVCNLAIDEYEIMKAFETEMCIYQIEIGTKYACEGQRCITTTEAPMTLDPTENPTKMTTEPTKAPTIYPTKFPTNTPTKHPTKMPTEPTNTPTKHPTSSPTPTPTQIPSSMPSTSSPTPSPTKSPFTKHPTVITMSNPPLDTLNPPLELSVSIPYMSSLQQDTTPSAVIYSTININTTNNSLQLAFVGFVGLAISICIVCGFIIVLSSMLYSQRKRNIASRNKCYLEQGEVEVPMTPNHAPPPTVHIHMDKELIAKEPADACTNRVSAVQFISDIKQEAQSEGKTEGDDDNAAQNMQVTRDAMINDKIVSGIICTRKVSDDSEGAMDKELIRKETPQMQLIQQNSNEEDALYEYDGNEKDKNDNMETVTSSDSNNVGITRSAMINDKIIGVQGIVSTRKQSDDSDVAQNINEDKIVALGN